MHLFGRDVCPLPQRRISAASCLLLIQMALVALAQTASAQTTVFLNVADSQVVDTTIRNGPYASYNHDSKVLVTRSSTIPDWERRTVMSFDTSSVPDNATITSATLRLTVKTGLGGGGATRPVSAYRLVSYFREREVTWLNRIAGTRWPTPGGDLGELVANTNVSNVAGTRVSLNLTALVQRAVNGGLASRLARVVLIDVGGGGDAKESYREYHSSEAWSATDRPQLTVTYGSGSGTGTAGVIDVPRGGDLQSALNQVQPGGTIRLAAGATYVGNFWLPAKGGTSYITLTTGGVTLPPAGTRITPEFRSSLATIKSPSEATALRTATAASYYRIVGVAFEANLNGEGDVITLGSDTQTTLSQVPHHIELDRVLITGDPAIGQKRGVSVNAAHVSIINSDIRDIKDIGRDSQAIFGWNTPGPITIRNNFLEAAGENIMFGGSHINIPNAVPSDIVIEGNLLTKDPKWRGTSWTVKNLFELKNARRVRVAGNVLEYNWAGAQQGFAIVLTPRNPSGRNPWAVVEDVQFIGNIIRHTGSVFNILGHDDRASTRQLARLVIRDNLAYDVHSGTWGGTGTFAQIGGEPRDITIDHNTVLHTGNAVLFYSGSYINSSGVRVTGGPVYGFVYTNNMAKHNSYGIYGDRKGFGTVALNYYAPGGVFRRNVLATDLSVASRYPPDTFFPSVSAFYAGFENAAARDYRLVASSSYNNAGTDGRDIGCAFPN